MLGPMDLDWAEEMSLYKMLGREQGASLNDYYIMQSFYNFSCTLFSSQLKIMNYTKRKKQTGKTDQEMTQTQERSDIGFRITGINYSREQMTK